MSYVTGRDPKLRELAQRLAPGRKVTRIQLDFSCRGIATATVEVHLDKSDMELVGEVVEEQQPYVTYVHATPVAPALSFPSASYMGRSVEAVDEPTIVE